MHRDESSATQPYTHLHAAAANRINLNNRRQGDGPKLQRRAPHAARFGFYISVTKGFPMTSKISVVASAKNRDTMPDESAPLRALAVDDDPITLSMACQMLEVLGLQVDTADDGIAALGFLDGRRYDLLLTDLQMPKIDGYALADMLKRRLKHLRVVIMTGCARPEVEEYMQTDLVDCWLFKPFSLEVLKERLQVLFGADKAPRLYP
jgi:CheY-like chemotaxis protein